MTVENKTNDRVGIDKELCEKCSKEAMLDLKTHKFYNNENNVSMEEYYKVCSECGNRVLCTREDSITIGVMPTYASGNTHKDTWSNSFNYEDYKYDGE